MTLTPQDVIATEAKYRNLERVWKEGHFGEGIAVPLIDTGVDPAVLPANSVQDSIDLTPDKDDRDYNGHGTLMARYILGMAPKAKIISIKIIGKSGRAGRADVVRALDYCVQMKPAPKFVNCSIQIRRKGLLGFSTCTVARPCTLCARVNQLWEHEIAVIAASGNYSSEADSLVCPANARWAIKVPSLQTAEDINPIEDDERPLLGTSQGAALLTGCLSVLGGAFPKRTGRVLAVLSFYCGTALDTSAKEIAADFFDVGLRQKTVTANVYRTYVLLKQDARSPNTVNIEKSIAHTKALFGLLKRGGTLDQMLSEFSAARGHDEGNYLAWLAGAVMMKQIFHDEKKAEELLARCNELLPPAEAFSNKVLFGGRP